MDIWREACEKTGANRDLSIPSELASLIPIMVYILDLYFQFLDNSMKLFLDAKKRISDAVEVFYDFDASLSSVSRNADLTSALLRGMSFVYRVSPSSPLFITH